MRHIMIKASLCATTALLVCLQVTPAYSYGSIGMFGGRPQPDYSLSFGNGAPISDKDTAAIPVQLRPRKDFDPIPLTLGSFSFYPSMETGMVYDSNIYASSTDTKDDFIGSIRPAITGVSNWGRHALSFTAFGDIQRFIDHTAENTATGGADVHGRLDINKETWLSGYGDIQQVSEPRASVNNLNGSTPTSFRVYHAGSTFSRALGVLQTLADYNFQKLAYDNVSTGDGGKLVEDNRNRSQHSFTAESSLNYNPNFIPFVRGGYNFRNYSLVSERNSTGYHADIGLRFSKRGLASLEVYGGWRAQSYDDFGASNKNNSIPDYGGKITWNITDLTTMSVEGNRSIEETSVANYNSFTISGLSSTITHELLRNVLIEADANYSHNTFNGDGNRKDDSFGGGGGVRWLLNRHFYTDVNYTWTRRVSNEDNNGYVDNSVAITLGSRL